jgi:hypothetical protein
MHMIAIKLKAIVRTRVNFFHLTFFLCNGQLVIEPI